MKYLKDKKDERMRFGKTRITSEPNPFLPRQVGVESTP